MPLYFLAEYIRAISFDLLNNRNICKHSETYTHHLNNLELLNN